MKTATTAAPATQAKPFLGYRNFYGTGKFKFFIYPDDNWDEKWGKKPLLGTIYADEPFHAVREAYSKGLAPVNFTFGLIALKEKLDPEQYVSRRYN
jgi:phage terminase large subunit-like protein